ncbi:MAG: hypothetical protein JSS53_01930 [Proteobacteria bacterium]|nr:hypothetical protein [Pseudomonadota bacterium]
MRRSSGSQIGHLAGRSWTRREVSGDGDCGYTAFGISRIEAYRLITVHLNDVKNFIKPAIHEALLLNNFLIYLKEHHVVEQNTTLEEIEENIEYYKNNLSILKAYIDYDIHDKKIDAGWAHPCILQALAQIQRIELFIWQLDQQSDLIPHPYYHHFLPPDAQKKINLLFTNGNHFDRLIWLNGNNIVKVLYWPPNKTKGEVGHIAVHMFADQTSVYSGLSPEKSKINLHAASGEIVKAIVEDTPDESYSEIFTLFDFDTLNMLNRAKCIETESKNGNVFWKSHDEINFDIFLRYHYFSRFFNFFNFFKSNTHISRKFCTLNLPTYQNRRFSENTNPELYTRNCTTHAIHLLAKGFPEKLLDKIIDIIANENDNSDEIKNYLKTLKEDTREELILFFVAYFNLYKRTDLTIRFISRFFVDLKEKNNFITKIDFNKPLQTAFFLAKRFSQFYPFWFLVISSLLFIIPALVLAMFCLLVLLNLFINSIRLSLLGLGIEFNTRDKTYKTVERDQILSVIGIIGVLFFITIFKLSIDAAIAKTTMLISESVNSLTLYDIIIVFHVFFIPISFLAFLFMSRELFITFINNLISSFSPTMETYTPTMLKKFLHILHEIQLKEKPKEIGLDYEKVKNEGLPDLIQMSTDFQDEETSTNTPTIRR